jgi:hypothetical protein
VGGINASKDKDVSPAKNERAQKKNIGRCRLRTSFVSPAIIPERKAKATLQPEKHTTYVNFEHETYSGINVPKY